MNKLCVIAACEGKIIARGWCHKHYKRWQVHGDPSHVENIVTKSPEEAMLVRTNRVGDCLIWTGALSSSSNGGYGSFYVGGKSVRVHRWVYEQVHGALPPGIKVDHLCHNTACCEITHLRAVTHKQNLEHKRGASKISKSGHLGVYWCNTHKVWKGQVGHGGKRHSKTFREGGQEAAIAYTIATRNKYFTHNDKDRQ